MCKGLIKRWKRTTSEDERKGLAEELLAAMSHEDAVRQPIEPRYESWEERRRREEPIACMPFTMCAVLLLVVVTVVVVVTIVVVITVVVVVTIVVVVTVVVAVTVVVVVTVLIHYKAALVWGYPTRC